MSASTPPARIVFLDRNTLSPETRLRAPAFPHELVVYDRTTAAEVPGRIAEADIIITNKVPIAASSIAAAPRLRMIAAAATGTDNIDVKAAAQRGIVVSNIRNYAVTTVPEHVFALMLALRRSIFAYRASVAAGRWIEAAQFCFFDHPVRELADSTLGIIGAGALGRAVGELGKKFRMKVLFAARKGTQPTGSLYTSFDEVLRTSDVISLHLPVGPTTRNLIGAAEFARMERRPVLINTARGGLVDEEALVQALTRGQLSGAGFDVATKEPPPMDHPLMRLLELPNFILTPHVAWASQEAIQALADQLIDNIDAFHNGQPRNVVAAA